MILKFPCLVALIHEYLGLAGDRKLRINLGLKILTCINVTCSIISYIFSFNVMAY